LVIGISIVTPKFITIYGIKGNSSRIPSFAEPFFLNFNADCEFRIAMSPEDLGSAGLDELGKKWS
jgi:hypothetical protein